LKNKVKEKLTNHLTGVFKEKPEVRKEYFDSIKIANNTPSSL
jgi:hypothetical protein